VKGTRRRGDDEDLLILILLILIRYASRHRRVNRSIMNTRASQDRGIKSNDGSP